MPALTWPPNPVFQSEGERKLFDILAAKLSSRDIVIANTRFFDREHGDVEVDLIVLIADKGCIVVENKGGNVGYRDGEWTQTDGRGTRKIDPHGQVIKNMYSFRNYVRDNWNFGNIKTDWAIALPSTAMSDLLIPGVPREKIIDRNQLEDAANIIIKISEKNSNKAKPKSPNWALEVFSLVKGRSDIDTDRDAVLNNNYEFIRNLTHEKRRVIKLIEQNDRIYVNGPAGSGKTWLAFEQARAWQKKGLKVGLISFNRGLASYLTQKNAELPESQRMAFVGTFHELMVSYGTSAGSMKDYPERESTLFEQMKSVIQAKPLDDKFDAFVVDEAQDIFNSWWDVLELLLRSETNKLAIFGDPDQSTYGQRGFPQGNFCKIHLHENLRNSQEIAQAARPQIQSELVIRGPRSFQVEYIVAPSEEEVCNYAEDQVAKLVDQELWNPGEIALLMTQHQHPIQKEKTQDLEGKEKYWSDFWANEEEFYGTVNGFKGLERSVVVLGIDGFHEPEKRSDVLYVGMTRARDRLIVVGTAQEIARIKKLQ